MRYGRNNSFLEFDGKFVGIDLGADYVSEHEWGIQDMEQAWGIPGKDSDLMGLPRRTITRVAKHYHSFLDLKEPMIVSPRYAFELEREGGMEKFVERYKDHRELFLPKEYPQDRKVKPFVKPHALATAWDGSEFGIKTTKEDVDKLKDLDTALRNNDAAIFVGKGHVFQNGGLKIVIASRVPEDGKKTMLEADVDSKKLKEASDATGIIEFLKKAKKEYFACSPRWKTENSNPTAYPVVYWLNPRQQEENNFGWFTVEELMQWADGKGPVPMRKEKVEKTS